MHTFKKKFFVAAAVAFICLFARVPKTFASTTVSSDITANTEWTSDGSPYVFTKGIKVPAGVTLTIDPGVTLTAAPSFVTPTNNVGLDVSGTLVAHGTSGKPIGMSGFYLQFDLHSNADISNASLLTVIGSGATIVLDSSTVGSIRISATSFFTADNVAITGTASLQTYIGSGSLLTMNGGTITNPNWNDPEAINFTGGKGRFTGVTIESVTMGMYIYGNAVFYGTGIVVKDCGGPGIELFQDNPDGYDNNFLNLQGSEIAGNAVGIQVSRDPTIQATGNSIHDNGYGVLNSNTSAVFPFAHNWWGDASGPADAKSNPGGKGDKTSDPVTISPWLTAAPFSPTVTPPFVFVLPPEPEPGSYQSPAPDPSSSNDQTPPAVATTTPDQTVTDSDTPPADQDTATSTPDSGTDQTDQSQTATSTPETVDDESAPPQDSTATTTPTGTDTSTDTDQSQTPPAADSSGDASLPASTVGGDESAFGGSPAQDDPIVPHRAPVLIVPGVLGTELSDPSEKLWLDLEHNLTDIGDTFMDPLQFNANLTPQKDSVSIGDILRRETANLVIAQATAFDYSYALISELEDQGYVEGTDLFVFPYDWRYGVNDAIVNQLRQKISAIEAQTGSTKVDIVAHSTGGLIVKKYAMEHPADNGIGKAVFVGVPNTGAPAAVKTLIEGDDFGIPMLAESEIRKLARNFPVVYDLAPSAAYYDAVGSYFQVIQRGLTGSFTQNSTISELDDRLMSEYGANSQALAEAADLHSASFDEYDLRTAGIDLYAIDGCKTGTFGGVAEIRTSDSLGNLLLGYGDLQEVAGDGTVPFASADHLPIDSSHRYYALQADHSQMLSQDGIREEIANILSGVALPVPSSLVTQDVSQCGIDGRIISVYSPLSIDVRDANGDHAGIASDGASVENTIPNADYEVFGEHKFVYLPTGAGQTYTVTVGGTGTGSFTLTDASVQDGAVEATQVFSDIPVTPNLKGNLDMGTNDTLSLDANGDGISDSTIEPSETLDAADSKDFYPEPDQSDEDAASEQASSTPHVSASFSSVSFVTPSSTPPGGPSISDPVETSSPVQSSVADSSTTETSTDPAIGVAASAVDSDVRFGRVLTGVELLVGLVFAGILARRALKK